MLIFRRQRWRSTGGYLLTTINLKADFAQLYAALFFNGDYIYCVAAMHRCINYYDCCETLFSSYLPVCFGRA